MICGLILAGGRSSRFGREKAVANLGGRPLIAWVAEVLSQGVDLLAANAHPASGAAAFALTRGLPCLSDEPSSYPGPLTGVGAGLRWARQAGAEWLATAPCDTPFLPKDFITLLAAGRSAGGAVTRTSGGLQPLCALWPTTAVEMLEALESHPPVGRLLAALGAAEVVFEDAAAFANLNTPGDFATAGASLDAPPR